MVFLTKHNNKINNEKPESCNKPFSYNKSVDATNIYLFSRANCKQNYLSMAFNGPVALLN